MPISINADVRRLSQAEFGAIAFKVMGYAFDLHRELGRLFDERVYQVELANRCSCAETEVRVEVCFDGFCKVYALDLLVENGALFEIKTVNALHDRHRAQLLNYLLLAGLAHGKLLNLRASSVQHEFVNTSLNRSDRTAFQVVDGDWQPLDSASSDVKQRLIAMLRDIGVGLDLQLYKEAVTHWLGGASFAEYAVPVVINGRPIGIHEAVCTPEKASIEITSLKNQDIGLFDDHFRRLLRHVDLRALHWINIAQPAVTFRTLLPEHRRGRE